MQALLFGACGRGTAAQEDMGQGSCVGYSTWEQGGDNDANGAKAWIRGLERAKCDEHGGLTLSSEDVPQDLAGGHLDLLRVALSGNKALRRLNVADVPPDAARLIAEAVLHPVAAAPRAVAPPPSDQRDSSGVSEVRFLGSNADDNLAKLMGMLLRPVFSHGMPALKSLTIANARRNLLTDAGGIPLVQALEENTRLESLVLFGTLLGDGTAWALCSALENNSSLENLAFYGKRLTGRGTAMFARLAKGGQTGQAGRRLRELVVGGTDFGEEDACELVRAVTAAVVRGRGSSASAASSSGAARPGPAPIQRFGLLSATLGDETCRAAAATGLMSCGLSEVSLVLGHATDEGLGLLASAAAAPAKAGDDDRKPLSHLRVASMVAGDASLEALEGTWAKPAQPLDSLQVAVGEATLAACSRCRSSQWSDRRFTATGDFGGFMDEVVFRQLFLRLTPDGQPRAA